MLKKTTTSKILLASVITFLWLVTDNIIAATKITLDNQITGVNNALRDALQLELQIKQENLGVLTTDKIQHFHQESPKVLQNLLETSGYFKTTIHSHLQQNHNSWSAIYKINPGPLLKITSLNLNITGIGATDATLMSEIKQFPLKTGDVFATSKYNAAKQFLFNQANNYGFLMAAFTQKSIKINLDNYTCDITLEFNTGSRHLFGPVIFARGPFSEKFLHRYLPFKTGEIYSAKKILKLQESLTNSNFFDQVTINPLVTNKDKAEVPIKIDLVPRKAQQFNFGAGYGTDTGARGLFGVEFRHLTPNGQNFKGLLKISEVQNNLEAHYLIPGADPTTDLYDFSAAGQTQNLDYGNSRTLQVAAGYLTTIKTWQQTLKLILQHENYEYTNQYTNNSNLIIPSLTWSHSSTDQYLKPTRGHSITFNILGSNKYLLAKTDFLQTQISAKYLVPFGSKNEMILRSNLGYTLVGDLSTLPLSMQFFTGGAQSIRGYGYNTIGPGKALAVGSIELRRQIIPDWYAGIFYDVGQASNSFLHDVKQGAGVGITWKTMLGSIALSYAKALNLEDVPGRIQFSMGPEF